LRTRRRSRRHNIGDGYLFDGSEQSCVMSELDALACRVVRIIGVAIALFHPLRLLRQLSRGLEIVGIELLRTDVIIGIRISDVAGLLMSLDSDAVLVALVKNVSRSSCSDRQQKPQRQPDSLFGFGAQHAVNLSDDVRLSPSSAYPLYTEARSQ